MKKIGTIDEWIKENPNAILTNDKVLQPEVGIIHFEKRSELFKADYASLTPNGKPVIWYGPSGFYRQKGMFRYSCHTVSIFSNGGSQVLSDEQANDPNWHEWEFDYGVKLY